MSDLDNQPIVATINVGADRGITTVTLGGNEGQRLAGEVGIIKILQRMKDMSDPLQRVDIVIPDWVTVILPEFVHAFLWVPISSYETVDDFFMDFRIVCAPHLLYYMDTHIRYIHKNFLENRRRRLAQAALTSKDLVTYAPA